MVTTHKQPLIAANSEKRKYLICRIISLKEKVDRCEIYAIKEQYPRIKQALEKKKEDFQKEVHSLEEQLDELQR